MPDSPTDPAAHPPQGAPVSSPNSNPSSVPVVADVRSLSNNSSSPAVNGVHTSPNGPVSPGSIGNSVTQLPPACGARQLSKLKRFLTTLQQFGSDISPEIGERVRGLVMNLVVCTTLLWLEFYIYCYMYLGLSLYANSQCYCETQKTVKTKNICGMSIVFQKKTNEICNG